MAVSTTQSIWRSGGGDNTRTAVCGTGIMAASFFIPAANTASDNVQASATNTRPVILPANAIVTGVIVSGDGAALETFDLGYTQYDGTGTPDPNGYVAAGAAAADYRDWETDRKSTRLNSSHSAKARMPSSA